MKIAMWSGPRNLSTAMMYSFASRSDCAVVDEPFYASYLHLTGLNHPMRDDILASQPTDPAQVRAQLVGSNPAEKPHFYQKHMTHHMVDGIPRDWMADVKNVFLLRHPARVIASFAKKHPDVGAADIGFDQQVELFEHVVALGQKPLVVDSADIRRDPKTVLTALCEALDLPWDPAMLSWAKGGHPDDGVWAAHWYDAVHNSTGFGGAEGPLPQLSGAHAELADQVMPAYQKMAAHKLG